MNVFIATLGCQTWNHSAAEEFRCIARRDRIQVHKLVQHPAEADIILLVDLQQHPDDWQLNVLRRHPLVRDYASKVFVYDERDLPWCAWPGVYVCMPRHSFDSDRQRAYSYSRNVNDLMTPSYAEPDLLFSFQGARSHPTRTQILALKHPRSLVEDPRISFFGPTGSSDPTAYQAEVQRKKQRYREIVSRSKFVLCPRGAGTSSFRLYETLAAGRVPVIISDAWVAPQGPDWDGCAIRIREAEVRAIPRLLERREDEFSSLSAAALHVHKTWFAPDVMFHGLIEQCADLLLHGQKGRHPLYFLQRTYLRNACVQQRSHLSTLVKAVLRKKGSRQCRRASIL